MSLFEKVKNIRRNNLQEKRKFPGDESGAYKRVKTDIEAKNLIKKAGGSGDIGFTAPDRKTKVAKRTKRAIKQGTPDPFDIDTSKAAKQTAKDFGTPTTKSQIKKLSKKPGGYSAPKGAFGPGITQGQANVKGMERRAFKITKPSDIKLPKSFTDFQKNLQNYKDNLQDYKDRDLPGGPRKPSKIKVSGADNLTRQDVGMAPPDKPRKVKQADISKKIARQNKEYNIDRKIKADDAKRFKDFEADAKFNADKYRKQRNAVANKKTLTGAEKSKAARELNRKVKSASELQKSYKLASKGYGTPGVTPIAKAKDLKAVTSSARVTVNKTLGKRPKPASKFRKFLDKIRTSKIGSKVVKGLSKSRYGKIAGAVLGATGAVAGISALSKREPKGVKLTSKDFVRGPVIRNLVKNDKGNLVAGKPKRFQLGQKITADDLKNTTYTKKIKTNA